MVLDSSAIVAIFQQEPGHQLLEQKIDQAEIILIGAPTMTEIAIVMARRSGRDYRPSLEAFLRRIDAQVVSFTEQHYSAASDAHLRFGRGMNSKAALNYGDCLSMPSPRWLANRCSSSATTLHRPTSSRRKRGALPT